MSVLRWELFDPTVSETYVFYINPSQGGSPTYQKNITAQATTAPGGKTLLFEGADSPQTFEFSGTILNQGMYDAMLHWYNKRRQVRITDDLGRQFWIYITQFEATRKRVAPPNHQWKHDFKISAFILNWN